MPKSLTYGDDDLVKKKKKLKKVSDVEAVPEKKKKKKVSAETVSDLAKKRRKKSVEEEVPDDLPVLKLPTGTPGRISKLSRKKKMRSIIGDNAEQIQQLLEAGDSDSAAMQIYKRGLQTLIDLVPYAEHNIRASKGRYGVYQINSLMQSIRELLVDIQSANDRGAVGERLIEKIVRPAFLDIGMAIMQEFAAIASDVKGELTPEQYQELREAMKRSQERIGASIQKQYFDVRDSTREAMQR